MTQMSLANENWVAESVPVVLARFRDSDFTIDDLHTVLPEPYHLNAWGALMLALGSRLVRVGFVKSKRPEANGRIVSQWRLR